MNGSRGEKVCVVVPMYNEVAVVGSVINNLLEHFDLVVCVDDGSTDGSSVVARSSGAIVLRHPVNLGQGAALRTGFEYVQRHLDATHVVTFDADGQHAPHDALTMVEHAKRDNLDVVLGTRADGRAEGQPFTRRCVLAMALLMSRWTSGLSLTDTHNGLRVDEPARARCLHPAPARDGLRLGARVADCAARPVVGRASRDDHLHRLLARQGTEQPQRVQHRVRPAVCAVPRAVIVKLLLIASVLAILAWVMRSRPSNHRLAVTRIASVGIAGCWILAVLNPGLVSWVANQIGVGRGTDLVLYLLVVVFTFTSVGQYQRLRQIDDRIAELARSHALLQQRDELDDHAESPLD